MSARWQPPGSIEVVTMEPLRPRIEALVEALRRRSWPPMTYMQIPSVLSEADRVIRALESHPSPDAGVAQALSELRALRAGFRGN